MIQQYSEAVRYLELAQQELRAAIDPLKAAEQTSITVTILSIDMVKRRIENLGKELE